MSTISTSSAGNGSEHSKNPTASKGGAGFSAGCDVDIRVDCAGDVNIYNCCTPGGAGGTPPPTDQPCFPPAGACLPVAAGAKHKMSRDQKLAKLAERARVPSALAAGTMHMARRFLLGKTPANALESTAFATFSRMSRGILSCTVAAFDAVPLRQRVRLFAPSLILDPDQPLDEVKLSTAVAAELKQRIGVQTFNDAQAIEEERPGRVRVYEPQGEDFFSQVRICAVNGLRTANFFPALNVADYLPSEIQQDCAPQIVDGQPQVVCQVRTTNCPGHFLTSVCARVLDIAQGDGVVLTGVNYFSVDAKVRFREKQTGVAVRDVDAFVRGDVDTPVRDGQNLLINDCRVHDQLTFQVPNDLAPGVYEIQVVVPNITGISVLGPELASNVEFISVIPPVTARFQIVTERIIARRETSPQSFGSDEVGLHTLAFPMFLDGTLGTDDQQRTEQRFKDIQSVDFDSGTNRDITRNVFQHDQPILAMAMCVRGDEIDSQRAYDQQITSSLDFFIDLIKDQAAIITTALAALGGIAALAKLGTIGAIVAGIALALTLAIDIIVALWAPADPIIRDSFALSIVDLTALTSANSPAPDPRTFEAENGIVVNVNKTISPVKLPFEYHETREYVSDDEDSRYEITYRFNRIA